MEKLLSQPNNIANEHLAGVGTGTQADHATVKPNQLLMVPS